MIAPMCFQGRRIFYLYFIVLQIASKSQHPHVLIWSTGMHLRSFMPATVRQTALDTRSSHLLWHSSPELLISKTIKTLRGHCVNKPALKASVPSVCVPLSFDSLLLLFIYFIFFIILVQSWIFFPPSFCLRPVSAPGSCPLRLVSELRLTRSSDVMAS